MHSQETINRFIQMRADGLSFEQIHSQLGVSKRTGISWAKAYNKQIAELRNHDANMMNETFLERKKERLTFYRTQFEKLKEELSSRNLEDLSTSKLLELMLRLSTAEKDEEKPTQNSRAASENIVFDLAM